MGYVIQDGGLFPHLTARRNIELMAREKRLVRGTPRGAARRAAAGSRASRRRAGSLSGRALRRPAPARGADARADARSRNIC